MSRFTDRLFDIEMDLAKNEGDDESSALSRRLVLRKALKEWGDERFDEGYHEGRRDIADARLEAKRRADEAEAAEPATPSAGEDQP